MSNVAQHIIIITCINIVSALGLHVITGLTGQFSLAHATFAGIGAYTSALLNMRFGIPFPLALLAGIILAGLAAIIVGYPSLRLRGDYLAIATLAFGEVFRVSMLNFKFTNGALGIHGIKLMTNIYWSFGAVIVCIFLTYMLTKSRIGRILIAIREDEVVAESFGAHLGRYKVFTFVVGGCFAGLSGGLYAHYLLFVNPTDFGVMKSVEVLLFLIIGGLGTIPGVLLGTILLTGLPELLRPFAQYRMLAYGIGLVLIMIYRPAGLLGNVNFNNLLNRSLQRLISKTKFLGKKAR